MLKKILGLLAMCFIVYSVPATAAATYTVDHIDDVSIVINGPIYPTQYQSSLGNQFAIRISQSQSANYLVLPKNLATTIKINGSTCLAFTQRNQGASTWLTTHLPKGTVVTPAFWVLDMPPNQMLNGDVVYIGDVTVNGVSVRQSLTNLHYGSPLSLNYTKCL